MPLKSHRSRLPIMAAILEFCKKPQLKTWIMYHANLSFYQLNIYLGELKETKLLEITFDNTYKEEMYVTTQLGLIFIEHVNAALQLVGPMKSD